MRRFQLNRKEDKTGISGLGIVLEGILYSSGSVSFQWRGMPPGCGYYPRFEDFWMIHVYKHPGSEIVWSDSLNPEIPLERGWLDQTMDSMENTPFASTGGIEKRKEMFAPHYIKDSEKTDYIRGYQMGALVMYGPDWQSCRFLGHMR